jgi:2-keto-4-pentenoate hydratase
MRCHETPLPSLAAALDHADGAIASRSVPASLVQKRIGKCLAAAQNGLMTTDSIARAAQILDEAYRNGSVISALPETLKPKSRSAAYALQAALAQHIGGVQRGWKIAATSKAGQAHINVDGPLIGHLMSPRQIENGGTLPIGPNRMMVAEIEFAFRMGETLAPRAAPYTRDEVMAAVESLHPSIEIPDSRYADFTKLGADQLIADNACARCFVLGDAMPEAWQSIDLAGFSPRGIITGRDPVQGLGANVLGDPREALTWAANEITAQGFTLAVGQIVMTGTCLVPLAIAAGDLIIGDFGALGRVEVSIT